jgi:hypothetical protein
MRPFRVASLILTTLCAAGALLWAEGGAKPFTAAQKNWWAFQKLVKPATPAVKDTAW